MQFAGSIGNSILRFERYKMIYLSISWKVKMNILPLLGFQFSNAQIYEIFFRKIRFLGWTA